MGKFRAALFSLQDWFLHSQRILPWRDSPEPYPVWISEIMLQQTQVVTVVPFFEKFIARFLTVDKLATAESDEVMKYWAGLGYYSRARNIHAGARKIWFELGGVFPSTREGWLAIPGVGPYTAGAILSIANNQPEAILDGNVERVLSRVRCVGRSTGDAVYKARLWRLSEGAVKTALRKFGIQPRVLNQAMMELGAKICTPKSPRCSECPVHNLCRAYQRGSVTQYPPKRAPKKWVNIAEEVICLMNSRGQVLVERKSSAKWRKGLWDLPSQLAGQNLSEANLKASVSVNYVVTRHKVTRSAKIYETRAWRISESDLSDERWVSIVEPEVPVGAAFVKTVKAALNILN